LYYYVKYSKIYIYICVISISISIKKKKKKKTLKVKLDIFIKKILDNSIKKKYDAAILIHCLILIKEFDAAATLSKTKTVENLIKII
jgi:hypothetical protein